MSIRFNHTIVHSRAKDESARFLADILGLPEPKPFGHFLVVDLDNEASLDFIDAGGMKFDTQHYAFLLDENDFDLVFGRIRQRGLEYWADPFKKHPGKINHHDGGRGVYFCDPDGHLLEVLTRPYGSGESGASGRRHPQAGSRTGSSLRPAGGGSPGDWRYFDQFAIRVLLLGNLGVVFFSFVPDVAAAAHIGNAGSWRIATGLLASYQLGILCWSIAARRRDIAGGSERLPRSGIPILATTAAITLFQFAAAAGLANEWLSLAYLLALLWMLGMSAFVFGVLLLEVSGPYD